MPCKVQHGKHGRAVYLGADERANCRRKRPATGGAARVPRPSNTAAACPRRARVRTRARKKRPFESVCEIVGELWRRLTLPLRRCEALLENARGRAERPLTPLQLRKRTRVDEPSDAACPSEREAALLQQVAELRSQLEARTAELSTLRALTASPRHEGPDGCVLPLLSGPETRAGRGVLPASWRLAPRRTVALPRPDGSDSCACAATELMTRPT